MRLTDLAAAVRKSGLRVVEESGWQSRGVGDFIDVATITCHHTAGSATGSSLSVCINGRADLAGPLCNLYLARDGTVHVVAAGYANHAGASLATVYTNRYAIGIEAENSGKQPWPAAQMAAYVRLCRALIDHYGLSVDAIRGHKETCSPPGRKTDPSFSMSDFRRNVAAQMKGSGMDGNEKLTVTDYRGRFVDGSSPTSTRTIKDLIGNTWEFTKYNAGRADQADGKLDALKADVAALRREVAALRTTGGGGGPSASAIAAEVVKQMGAKLK